MNNLTITYSAGVHHVVTSPLYQGDYGQQITFAGIDGLPASFEVHFSNEASKGISTRSIGLDSVVNIPNMYLQTGEVSIYGWVFLHDPATSGETEYTFRIPVKKKPAADPVIPTPPQEDVIAQAINAINGAAEDAAQSATDAQTAQGLAEDARDAAQAAQGLAETAQGKAEDAQEAAETAQGKAETAQGKAEDAQSAAEAQAVLAESYAKGGTNTRTGENADNAKYYAEQSAGSASTASGYVTDAQGYASDASGYANDAKDYKNAAGDYATEAYGYKNDASGSASEASGYANDAKGYKNDASGYASDASGYASAASGSASSAEAEALKSEGYADGKQNGTNVGSGSPYYHNNSKYYSQLASGSATAAGDSAEDAEAYAKGTRGGTAVESDDPAYHNNSKYYSEQAADSATSAATSAATFETDATLSVAGKAADAKKTGDEIADLKSHLYDILPTDTASGAIASFPDGANDIPLVDMTVNIEPVQDLHGQSAPYPAGGGKNLWDEDYTGISTTITYKPLNVGSGSFTLSTTNPQVESGVYNLFLLEGNVSSGASSMANGVWANNPRTVTAVDGYVTVAFRNYQGGVSPANSQTQLEKGSTATSYAPYSNICPITGWTGADVWRTGKNLINISDVVTTSASYLFNGAVSFPAGEYVFAITKADSVPAGGNISIAVVMDDGTNATVYSSVIEGNRQILYVRATNKIVVMRVYTVAGDYRSIQLELGSTATAYHSYSGTTYPISWQTEAGTVYGGSDEIVSGELTSILHYHEFTASDTVMDGGITDMSTASERITRVSYYLSTNNLPTADTTATDKQTKGKFSHGAYLGDNSAWGSKTYHGYAASNQAHIFLNCDATAEAVSAYLTEQVNNGTPVALAYPLATDSTYQLDTNTLSTLYGDNNIWADTGDVSVTYKADVQKYIDKKLSS